MFSILNIINSITESNFSYYLLVVILVIIVVAMIYLIISQNNEIKAAKQIRDEWDEEEIEVEESKPSGESLKKEVIEEVEEVEEPEVTEGIDDEAEEEVEDDLHIAPKVLEEKYDSVLELDSKDEEDNENVELELSKMFDEGNLYEAKVEDVEDIDISSAKKQEILDATLTNIPNISLLDQTMTSIPPLINYLDEKEDLVNLTKELAAAPKEKNIKLTPYEEEQEESAIISYDELLENRDNAIVYSKEEKKNDVSVKEIDLEKTVNLVLDEKKNAYEHEESFLDKLKSLQSKIN